MAIKDGGPAFAHAGYETQEAVCRPQSGMSLRDWLAGQAIIGYLAGFTTVDAPKPKIAAHVAYQYADAMLAERLITY